MTEYIYNGKAYNLPDNWNEVSANQLVALMAIKDQPTSEEMLLRALHVLLGYGKLRFFFMPLDAKFHLLPYVRWVMESTEITHNPLLIYDGLFGPASEFDNLRMCEFREADMAYRSFIETEDINQLNRLIAILYRPQRTDGVLNEGDMRAIFNPNTVDARVQQILNWPMPVKQAILFWYEGCQHYLVKLYNKAFAKKSDSDTASDTGSDGMFLLMRSIAKTGIYGNIEAVEQLSVHTIFSELEAQMAEAERAEQLEKQNTDHV